MSASAADPQERARQELAATLEAQGLLRDPRVKRAFLAVPRHAYIPERHQDSAYVDTPIPLPDEQTVSAPHMVLIMLEALDVQDGQRVLEVGAGSGYHAALLAELAGPNGEVWSIERIPALARLARENLARTGHASRVHLVVGDGSLGLPGAAPFDRIHVAAGGPRVPRSLLAQLAPGGILLVPVGSATGQDLMRIRKDVDGAVMEESLGPVIFVPLVGEEGFRA